MLAILTLGLLATTAVEEPVTLQRNAPWVVDSNENFCRLKADFGGKKDRVTARLAWYGPGDAFALTLIGPRARKNGPYAKVDLDFGLGRIETTADTAKINYDPALLVSTVAIVPRPEGDGAHRAAVTPAQEDMASTLTVSVDGRDPFRLALGPLAEPMSVVRTCLDKLIRQWKYDPDVFAHLLRRAEPVQSPSRWLTAQDYPDGAVMFSAGGVVRFRLDIDEQGKVADCLILFRTKPDDFADLTCAAMRTRALFRPALDADGKPVRSFFVSAVTFRMPT